MFTRSFPNPFPFRSIRPSTAASRKHFTMVARGGGHTGTGDRAPWSPCPPRAMHEHRCSTHQSPEQGGWTRSFQPPAGPQGRRVSAQLVGDRSRHLCQGKATGRTAVWPGSGVLLPRAAQTRSRAGGVRGPGPGSTWSGLVARTRSTGTPCLRGALLKAVS